ncbi:DUF6083 domain-containing protein [Streptomyces sp. NPDC058391]|uniref:DUF6083 domain-containing protein n=1 Tax=Streptomyces sp. NPDC058391 TaxID=3346476 RepID=UPI003665E59F
MSIRLHMSNQSRLMRKTAVDRCKFCGTPIAWFDRFDHLIIPLTSEFPARRVPAKFRWHINRGIAYPGGDAVSGYCRIPHPAVCPVLQHENLPKQLQGIVQRLGVRIQKRIDSGTFVPSMATEEAPEDREMNEAKQEGNVRHILSYYEDLRLAPCAIKDVRCVARDEETAERCDQTIFALEDGRWQRVEIPYAAGRAGQMILSENGGFMYAWSVPEFSAVHRWWKQRCYVHFGSMTPDHVGVQWVRFSTLRHADFLVAKKPEGYERPLTAEEISVSAGPGHKQKCSTPGCSNGTVIKQPENWICWACAKKDAERNRIHQKWQGSSTRK